MNMQDLNAIKERSKELLRQGSDPTRALIEHSHEKALRMNALRNLAPTELMRLTQRAMWGVE